MLLVTDAPLALRCLYELGFARHVRGAPVLDFDPRTGVEADGRRKVGRNIKLDSRRVFVVGSKGSGKVRARRCAPVRAWRSSSVVYALTHRPNSPPPCAVNRHPALHSRGPQRPAGAPGTPGSRA